MPKLFFIVLLSGFLVACQSVPTTITKVETKVLVPPKQLYICDLAVKLTDPQSYSLLDWSDKEDALIDTISVYIKKTTACQKQTSVLDEWFSEQTNIYEKK